MIAALIQGSLFRGAEQRTSKIGKPFAVATVKVKDGDVFLFVRAIAFSESAQSELMRLADGDSLSVQGALKIETYVAADGATKISLSVVAEQILPLRQQPKKRETKAKPSPSVREQDRAFDDSIPF